MSDENCVWFKNGTCKLETLPDKFIEYILRRNPSARRAVLDPCEGCSDPDEKWVKLAKKKTPLKDLDRSNSDFQDAYSEYRDHHKRNVQPPQQPVIDPGSGEDE